LSAATPDEDTTTLDRRILRAASANFDNAAAMAGSIVREILAGARR